MNKNILFLLIPDYKAEEFSVPYNDLKNQNFHIDVAGLIEGEIHGTENHSFMPNLVFNKITIESLDKYDALIIPGGPGSTEYLWENKNIQKIIRYFYDNHKIVAAICHACVAIAETGILENKKATVYPSNEALEHFEKNNVIFEEQGVVVLENDKIITAQGPKYAKKFGQAIINMLKIS